MSTLPVPESQSPTLTRADDTLARLALALCALELGLPRVTGEPQSVLHVSIDIVCFGLLSLALHRLARVSARAPRLQRRLLTVAVAVLLGAFTFLLVGPALYTLRLRTTWWIAGGAAGVAAAAGLLWLRSLPARTLPALGALVVLAASWLCWLMLGRGQPPAWLGLGLAGWCAGVAWVASRERAWLLAPPLAAALAVLPLPSLVSPSIAWRTGVDPAKGPDIVLVVADTLRADVAADLQFAKQLVRAGHDLGPAQSASSWTLPAMASLFSSLPVEEHGAIATRSGQKRALRAEVKTLTEYLSEAGYDTAAVLAENVNVGPKFGFARGFDYFDYDGSEAQRFDLPITRSGPARPLVVQLLFGALILMDAPELKRWTDYGGRNDGQVLVQRVERVLQARRQRPLFLWVHFMDVHLPYHHAADLDAVPRALRGKLTDMTGDPVRRKQGPWGSDSARAALRSAYRFEAQHLDRALVALERALGPAPPWGRVFVLTADHGEELFEHGSFEHGHAFYQEVVGVPLIVSGTRLVRPAEPASSLDIAPTLLAAAGLPVPPTMRGHDLHTAPPLRRLTSRNLMRAPNPTDTESAFAVRRGQWKLIDHGGVQLFDLAEDPGELHDRAAQEPELSRSLRSGGAAPIQRSQDVQLDPAEVEALRALGYVE